MKNNSDNAPIPESCLASVSGSAITWWNSLTKSGRRELRIKQIGETAFWNTFSISIDEIVDLYEHYR